MKRAFAASVVASMLVLSPAAFAASPRQAEAVVEAGPVSRTPAVPVEAGERTLTVSFARSLRTLFAETAQHVTVDVMPGGAVIAENQATNLMVARRNPDGTLTIHCVDNEEAAHRFFTAANRTAATAAPEVK